MHLLRELRRRTGARAVLGACRDDGSRLLVDLETLPGGDAALVAIRVMIAEADDVLERIDAQRT